jgi:hypothetical protein
LFSIHCSLTFKSKLPDVLQTLHLKISHTLSSESTTHNHADCQLLGRDKSKIICELRRKSDYRGYLAKQACELACKRAESNHNACTLGPRKVQARQLLRLQLSPEQIARKLPMTHESLTCMFIQTKRLAARSGRSCVVKSIRECKISVRTAKD